MTEAQKIIAEAAALPLNDAAYWLWRESSRLDSLELPPMTPEQRAIAMATPMGDFGEQIERAVAMAAKDHPGYLERTYQRAEYYILYYMK